MLAATVAWGDGIQLNGVSPRSIGRGGTNLGFADNGGILFDNPAGAVNITSDGLFEVVAGGIITDMHYSEPQNSSMRDINLVPIPQMAFIKRSDENENLAYGFGIFTPAGFMQSWRMNGPYGAAAVPYNSWGSLTKFLPCVAYKVTDQLSIGGSFGLAICHTELEGPYTLQNSGPLTGLPTFMNLHASGAAPIFSLGMQYQVSEATTVGLAYQSESRFHLTGTTDATLPVVGPYPFDTHMNVTWPRTLGLGFRHQIDPVRVFSMDVIWFNWSSAFDDIGITLTDGAHPNVPAIHDQFPLRWQDSVSFRFGYEAHVRQPDGPHRICVPSQPDSLTDALAVHPGDPGELLLGGLRPAIRHVGPRRRIHVYIQPRSHGGQQRLGRPRLRQCGVQGVHALRWREPHPQVLNASILWKISLPCGVGSQGP